MFRLKIIDKIIKFRPFFVFRNLKIKEIKKKLSRIENCIIIYTIKLTKNST